MRPVISTGIGVLALALGLLPPAAESSPAAAGGETKTLKEQLSDKASDNQRVDNCHVPPERRGPVPRSDCPAQEPAPVPAPEKATGEQEAE